MSTVVLARADATHEADYGWASRSLRTWLCGDWAILFSRPEDFVPHDWEVDRWVLIMRRAFSDRGIRPLALASPILEEDRNWVAVVNGDAGPVILEDGRAQNTSMDFRARTLREAIISSGRRFVMIIDGALSVRRTFRYRAPWDLPSPLELLGWTDALRARQNSERDDKSGCVCSMGTRDAAYQ